MFSMNQFLIYDFAIFSLFIILGCKDTKKNEIICNKNIYKQIVIFAEESKINIMVKSMTGFGKITIENGNRKVVIEIKSLNSKTLDLNLKMPNLYKEKEMEIRNIVKRTIRPGKVEMCIYFDNTESDKDVTINKPVVTQYFNQLLDIANELGIEADKNKILQTVMRFPDTLQIKSAELEDTEWEALEAGIKKLWKKSTNSESRKEKALIKDICHRIELIQELSAQVPQFEVKRVEVIRQKLQEKNQ